jgi:multicomponent Na+:H+ antiporter subunit B
MKDRRSPLLEVTSTGLFFALNVFAIYLLLRGHNEPGGGFIGGLVAAISFVLLMLGHGVDKLRAVFPGDPARVAFLGLLLALGTALLPLCWGGSFLQHYNFYLAVPLLGKVPLGTPLLFDAGVYLLVVGITARSLFALVRSTHGIPVFDDEEYRDYAAPAERWIEESAADLRRDVKTKEGPDGR